MKYKMAYNVPDVEHTGDVNSEIGTLIRMGATYLDSEVEWGSEEIEDAAIFIEVEDSKLKEFIDYGCYRI